MLSPSARRLKIKSLPPTFGRPQGVLPAGEGVRFPFCALPLKSHCRGSEWPKKQGSRLMSMSDFHVDTIEAVIPGE